MEDKTMHLDKYNGPENRGRNEIRCTPLDKATTIAEICGNQFRELLLAKYVGRKLKPVLSFNQETHPPSLLLASCCVLS
jgi:hypothetical protein